MRIRHLLFTILAAAPLLSAPTCQTIDDIVLLSPASNLVSSFTFQVQFQLIGSFVPGSLEASLNFTPLSVSGGPIYSATVNPGPPLQDHNVLLLRARRQSDNKFVTRGLAFDYLPPKARATLISDPGVLPHGPLAHGKVGDYMLENSDVRFVVQDANQRDLYSVGAFGGNIIDAVRVADPNRDNFLEVQPMLNIETVINATSIEIVNDGQDGTAAIIRTCGPDDLLDFVNPSAQIRPFAPTLNFPAAADDNDQPIEACTEYRLSPQKSYLAMETTVENMGPVPLKLFVGDWMNAGGELEQWFAPGAGFGAGLFGELQSLSFVGYGEAQGIDYSFVSIPKQEVQTPTDTVEKSNFFNTSGVSVILNNMDIIQAVAVGALPPFTVPAGGSRSYLRYFGVGDGSGSNATDIRNEVLGTGVGTLAGCVTMGGAPAPRARVAVGQPINLVTLSSTKLISNAETDASGCYSLTLPVGKLRRRSRAPGHSLPGRRHAAGRLERRRDHARQHHDPRLRAARNRALARQRDRRRLGAVAGARLGGRLRSEPRADHSGHQPVRLQRLGAGPVQRSERPRALRHHARGLHRRRRRRGVRPRAGLVPRLRLARHRVFPVPDGEPGERDGRSHGERGGADRARARHDELRLVRLPRARDRFRGLARERHRSRDAVQRRGRRRRDHDRSPRAQGPESADRGPRAQRVRHVHDRRGDHDLRLRTLQRLSVHCRLQQALARLDGLGHRGAPRHGFPVAGRLLGDPGAAPRHRAREPDGDARHHRAGEPHRKPLQPAQDRHLAGAAGGWLERGGSSSPSGCRREPGTCSTCSRRRSSGTAARAPTRASSWISASGSGSTC